MTRRLDLEYSRLTADERYRLVLAAGLRGDKNDQDRLIRTAGKQAVQVQDYRFHAEAFDATAKHAFIDLAEDAASFRERLESIQNAKDEEADGALEAFLAAAYVLWVKGQGWNRYCEGLAIPPFALWDGLPGFHRLQAALWTVDRIASQAGGFAVWLTCRPRDDPRLQPTMTADSVAKEYGLLHRKFLETWIAQSDES
jgi:hypothetical protein